MMRSYKSALRDYLQSLQCERAIFNMIHLSESNKEKQLLNVYRKMLRRAHVLLRHLCKQEYIDMFNNIHLIEQNITIILKNHTCVSL